MAPELGALTPFRAACLAGPLGVVMLLGGPRRVGGPSYSTVVATGGEVVWGIGFLILSVALLVANRWWHRLLFHAYMAAATGYALFVAAFISAAFSMSTAGLTGIVVYGWVAWMHIIAAAAVSTGAISRFLLRVLRIRRN
ncbi:hypothetical protein [Rhodococcoides kyotonense]|uniref:Uncharacterized protein n=1 Tax=Rhodococcoides kyotonense TaxID=398843 RepID=A0A239FNZ0_9NOCA|nr:hypothetical protein [Rhodococcus kyotonensis]SNS58571.1 hypothetical protein SAMN05421642_103390 [Rhodococcus kyotonensis]